MSLRQRLTIGRQKYPRAGIGAEMCHFLFNSFLWKPRGSESCCFTIRVQRWKGRGGVSVSTSASSRFNWSHGPQVQRHSCIFMSGKKAPSVIWHLSRLSGAFMREESNTLNLDERQLETQLSGYTYFLQYFKTVWLAILCTLDGICFCLKGMTYYESSGRCMGMI